MLKLLITSFFCISSLASSAFADDVNVRMYAEPKVGFGTSAVSYKAGTTDSKNNGALSYFVSSVVGWHSNDIYFGFDFRYDNAIDAVSNTIEKNSFNLLTMGLGFGYTLEYTPMRWYLSMDLQQRAWTSSQTMSDAITTGGYRMGISYYLRENLLLNFDYTEPYYKSGASTGEKVEAKIYGISLSIPMDFAPQTVPWRERRGMVSEIKPDSTIKNLDFKDEINSDPSENFDDQPSVLNEVKENEDKKTAEQSSPDLEESTAKASNNSSDDLSLEETPAPEEELPESSPEDLDNPVGEDDLEL